MDNLEFNSRILTIISMSLSASWFALHLDMIVGIVTLIALISAIIANVARIKRDNTSRKIEQYKLLDEEIKHKKEDEE